jgi:hypothetical protein
MLIQSQLSCNLPLILICPDYAIFACFFRTICGVRISRIHAEQSGKMRENSGNNIQLLPVLLPALDDVRATCNPSLTAVHVAIAPAATDCYNFLCFVSITHSSSPRIAIEISPIMTDFAVGRHENGHMPETAGIAALADAQQTAFAAAGVLPGHEPQPDGELTLVLKCVSVANGCHNR